jgi:hypothetical protein
MVDMFVLLVAPGGGDELQVCTMLIPVSQTCSSSDYGMCV